MRRGASSRYTTKKSRSSRARSSCAQPRAVERPRASNANYGAAKAGLDALAQGLAEASSSSGVRVLVVLPVFVKTRMTGGISLAPFATTLETVAEATVGAPAGRAHTILVPARLRLIFTALRHLPRAIYRGAPL